MMHEPTTNGGSPERFEYFMVRVTRSLHHPDRLVGLVERLGSGEKRSFETGEQLLQLFGGGITASPKMQPGTGHRNAGLPDSDHTFEDPS
jgi:hypothetical protein